MNIKITIQWKGIRESYWVIHWNLNSHLLPLFISYRDSWEKIALNLTNIKITIQWIGIRESYWVIHWNLNSHLLPLFISYRDSWEKIALNLTNIKITIQWISIRETYCIINWIDIYLMDFPMSTFWTTYHAVKCLYTWEQGHDPFLLWSPWVDSPVHWPLLGNRHLVLHKVLSSVIYVNEAWALALVLVDWNNNITTSKGGRETSCWNLAWKLYDSPVTKFKNLKFMLETPQNES